MSSVVPSATAKRVLLTAYAAACSTFDVLDAADAEDALSDALEGPGVQRAWALAEPLAIAGVDEAWLRRIAALAGPGTQAALEWVAASLTARALTSTPRPRSPATTTGSCRP
jgi:hypothetical protein